MYIWKTPNFYSIFPGFEDVYIPNGKDTLNVTKCSLTVIHESGVYPSYKYWFQISSTSLIDSSLLLCALSKHNTFENCEATYFVDVNTTMLFAP